MKYQGLAFKNRKIDFHKLKQYGFRQKDGSYIFNTKLKKGECKRTHGLISIYRWFDFFGKLTR